MGTISKKLIDKQRSGRKERSVEWDGETYVIRQPSYRGRGRIMQKSRAQVVMGTDDRDEAMGKLDMAELMVWAVIDCVYTESGTKVFDESDYEDLMGLPAGGFVDEFGSVALELMNIAPEEDAKNSPETQED